MKSYFRQERISERIVRIISAAGEMQYLITGSERAALLDTGTGVGNIREYVESLTDKPVTAYLTHGHCDHAGGAGWFDEVYLAEADYPLFQEHSRLDVRKEFMEMCFAGRGEHEFPPDEDYADNSQVILRPLKEGDIIDLGDAKLETFSGSGHTRGSLCFYDRAHREVFLGDAINGRMFLFLPECSTVEEYLETLRQFQMMLPGFDHMYIAHDPGEITADYITDMIELCEEIMNGQADDVPFTFLGKKGYLAKHVDHSGCREDGKSANIVYDKQKIFRTEE